MIPILEKRPAKPDDIDNPVRIAFGADCPQAVMERFAKRFGCTCMEGFGMTEIGIPVHTTLYDRRPGSSGKTLPIYEIELFDDEDKPVPPGVPAEIVFRPKEPSAMMIEYYNMPEKTLESFRNLWFHTGDLAKRDEDGYLSFVDRKKDASGGEERTSHLPRWRGPSARTRRSSSPQRWPSSPSSPRTR